MKEYSVVVTDTSPLITLAKAGELDALLRLGVIVRIPDIVYLEATREGHVDGVKLVDWARANGALVRITPTSRVVEWQILKENGFKAKDYGEIAAIEVVTEHARQHPEEGILLLYEDSDMNKFAVRAEVDMATTGTFLAALEEARLIQSADRILDQATAAGRNVARQREQAGEARIADAIRKTAERNRDRGPGGFDR